MAVGDTETSICNTALTILGVERINTLDDESKAGRLCKEQYPLERDKLIRSHPWNFAIDRRELALVSGTPEFGFDNSFAIPLDCLRVLGVNDVDIGAGNTPPWTTRPTESEFKIEKGRLLSDESEIKIKFIQKITDASKFDSNFTDLLSWMLAKKLAYALIQSVSLAANIVTLANEELKNARTFDAQEGTPDELEANVWLQSRL